MSLNEDAFIHLFPGVAVNDMHSYCKPLIDKTPNTIMLHCGTNTLLHQSSRLTVDTTRR